MTVAVNFTLALLLGFSALVVAFDFDRDVQPVVLVTDRGTHAYLNSAA